MIYHLVYTYQTANIFQTNKNFSSGPHNLMQSLLIQDNKVVFEGNLTSISNRLNLLELLETC